LRIALRIYSQITHITQGKEHVPKRNLGKKVAILYLLVAMKFDTKSPLAGLLFNAMTLSPVNSVSFCQGHLHLFRLDFNDDFGGCAIVDEKRVRFEDVKSSSSKFHPCGIPSPRVILEWPAGAAAERLNGNPLSCDSMALECPKAESGA
jgi:hypothetical protein